MNTPLTLLALALSAAPFLVGQEVPPPPPPVAPPVPKAAKVAPPPKVSRVSPPEPQAPPAPVAPVAPKAQVAPPPPPAAPAPPSAPSDLDPAIAKQFRSKLFVTQHRDPGFLARSLRPLLSGVKGAVLDYNTTDGMKTLTVRDFPENVATIEEALKRLDVPAAANARKDVEFQIHVLFASSQETKGDAVPDDLKPVLSSLKSTLKYRFYSHAATFTQRTTEPKDPRAMNGSGQVDLPLAGGKGEVQPLTLEWLFWPKFGVNAEGAPVLNFQNFRVSAKDVLTQTHGGVSTVTSGKAEVGGADIVLKSGETVIVGTSTMRDRAIIVVLSAKMLN